MTERKPHNASWVIVSVNKPIMMRRSDDEIWLLNPKRRYILNSDALEDLKPHIETMSDLHSATHFKPLYSATKVRLPQSSLLIERYRDRGIGDLLFTTGPLAYLHHITGGDIKTFVYAYAERGSVLNQCPYISDNSPLVGPILYDDLHLYDYHWFIDTATEYTEEPDQSNVYDTLFRSLGIDPSTVDAKFKRPYAALAKEEEKQLDDFFYWAWASTKLHPDLRKTGYYLVAPFANSNLRTAPYSLWLQIIEELCSRKPVIVLGALRERMPTSDMSPGDFISALDTSPALGPTGRLLNLIGKTSVRNMMQLISKASCVASMDSAALYIAQALRVPCVSLWGSHDPAARIGYDRDYLELAVWNSRACPKSPCYAWEGFPESKCPLGAAQQVCQCLSYADPKEVIGKFDAVESKFPKVVSPSPVKT
jgi:ADP-heptose:LPS heptosyltransferase